MFEWHDDKEMTVICLNEKPSECEVTITISPSEDVVRFPGVAGVYRANGTYCKGRPVLQHSGGEYVLYASGYWNVRTGVNNFWSTTLWSRTAPSLCPADPRAARNEMEGLINWTYAPKIINQSDRVSLKCKVHDYQVLNYLPRKQ